MGFASSAIGCKPTVGDNLLGCQQNCQQMAVEEFAQVVKVFSLITLWNFR